MESLDPFERSTETLAPDADEGPFRVTLHWRLLAQRWEAVGISLEFADQGEARALQTTDLRRLRLPPIIERAGEELRRQLAERDAELKTPPAEPLTGLAYRKRLLEARLAEEALAAAEPRRPGRPPMPLTELERVARIYGDAFYSHQPPTKAVAAQLGITYSAAAKRIATCRRSGLLGSAERGKASVGALIGRGDAASLARQIAGDEEQARRREQKASAEAQFIEKTSRPEDGQEA